MDVLHHALCGDDFDQTPVSIIFEGRCSKFFVVVFMAYATQVICTHADNLALDNTDPPEQQAYTTTLLPREVVGPLIEVVARPTLTPRDQTLNYTENELRASFLRASC